jgi:serine/threonine-protein kinase
MKKNIPLLLITALLITSCGKELEFNTPPGSNSSSTNISTFAGSGTQGSADGTGINASFYQPTGVAADASGNIYVADFRNNLIRKISPGGVVTIFAGSGVQGSANGTGVYASFYQPTSVAADASGNIYVADDGNHLIREISPAGVVTTLAGSGVQGSANGTGIAASFSYPQGVAVDASGNVYVADYGNNMVREITQAGVVTTLAGSSTPGSTNGISTVALFNEPTGVAVDAHGNVYVADYGNDLIREITPAGVVTTLAGSGTPGSVNGTGAAAAFNQPTGVAVDAKGNVYVADYGNNLIREISPAGVVTTLGSGAGGTGTVTAFNGPYGVAVDAAGNVYVAGYGNSTILKITR